MKQPEKKQPGWYADPELVNTMRYWDGEAWTDRVAPTSSGMSGSWMRQPVWLRASFVVVIAVAIVVFLVIFNQRNG